MFAVLPKPSSGAPARDPDTLVSGPGGVQPLLHRVGGVMRSSTTVATSLAAMLSVRGGARAVPFYGGVRGARTVPSPDASAASSIPSDTTGRSDTHTST